MMKQNNFDFLRFLFAFIVVIGHLIEFSGVEVLRFYAHYFNTYFSITGFFIISGFLITGSYLRTSSVKRYFTKRAARLLPAYILVVVLSVPFFSFMSNLPFNQYFSDSQLYKYLFANLTFLNFLQPCLPGVFNSSLFDCSINPALWTLKIEVSFYFVVPLLIYIVKKIRSGKYVFFLLIYFLSIIYKYFFVHLNDSTGNNFYIMLSRQLPGAMMYFVSGMALYYYYFDTFHKYKWWLLLPSIVILLIEKHFSLEIFTPIAFSIVIFVIAFSFKFLNNFGKYGDISYGIYIFHSPILKTFVYFGIFEIFNPYLSVLFLVLIVILIGFLSWHFLEKKWLYKVNSKR